MLRFWRVLFVNKGIGFVSGVYAITLTTFSFYRPAISAFSLSRLSFSLFLYGQYEGRPGGFTVPYCLIVRSPGQR